MGRILLEVSCYKLGFWPKLSTGCQKKFMSTDASSTWHTPVTSYIGVIDKFQHIRPRYDGADTSFSALKSSKPSPQEKKEANSSNKRERGKHKEGAKSKSPPAVATGEASPNRLKSAWPLVSQIGSPLTRQRTPSCHRSRMTRHKPAPAVGTWDVNITFLHIQTWGGEGGR